MPDQPDPNDADTWCEVCQKWVTPGYADAHRTQLDEASRDMLHEVLARLREQHQREHTELDGG